MQNWKFLLVGVTGDLSKKKILPALAQFADINKNEVKVDLIGYSRSMPNDEEIKSIIGSKLNSVKYVQGEYSDPTFFKNLLESTSDRVVVYLAVPPGVFLDLLETFCPFNNKNLNIIIEKPFGRNLEEANLIINKINECKLNNNVHFCDHYLFKPGAEFSNETLDSVKFLHGIKIKSILVEILENINVKGRGGYYDQTGALTDMFPAHVISLLKLVEQISGDFKIESLIDSEIKTLKLGQYKNYLEDLEIEKSETETYFDVSFDLNELNIEAISGKALEKKLTKITIDFVDTTKLEIEINPDPKLVLTKDGESHQILDLNLGQSKLDHTRMFEDILNNNFDKFYSYENAIIGWKVFEKIVEFKKVNNVVLTQY